MTPGDQRKSDTINNLRRSLQEGAFTMAGTEPLRSAFTKANTSARMLYRWRTHYSPYANHIGTLRSASAQSLRLRLRRNIAIAQVAHVQLFMIHTLRNNSRSIPIPLSLFHAGSVPGRAPALHPARSVLLAAAPPISASFPRFFRPFGLEWHGRSELIAHTGHVAAAHLLLFKMRRCDDRLFLSGSPVSQATYSTTARSLCRVKQCRHFCVEAADGRGT